MKTTYNLPHKSIMWLFWL